MKQTILLTILWLAGSICSLSAKSYDYSISEQNTLLTKKILSFIVDQDTVSEGQKMLFSSEAKYFTFIFSNDYAADSIKRIRYKLAPLQEQWQLAKSGEVINFYNLSYGEYLLEVEILDMYEGTSTHELFFQKKRDFYHTPIFYILLGLGLILIIIGAFKYKAKGIQQRSEDLLQLLWQRTAEINKQNEEIVAQKGQLETAYQTISTVNQIGKEITAALDPSEMVDKVYDHISKLMPIDIFGIGVYKPEMKWIEFTNYYRRTASQPVHIERMSDAYHLSVQCVKGGKEILYNNLKEEYADYEQYVKELKLTKKVPQSVMYHPLIVEDTVVGVVTVKTDQVNAYKEKEHTVFQALSSYISIAVANSKAYQIIQQKNTSITDSIRYAQTIQEAVLPAPSSFEFFSDYFIFFQPKDIVSGDFYWTAKVDKYQFVIAADCTGHGVPGAFMSMIGNSILNQIIKIDKEIDPSMILENLHVQIRTLLRQKEKKNTDGMDLALVRLAFDPSGEYCNMVFSGAKRPVYFTQNGQLCELKGDNKNIGGFIKNKKREFTNKEAVLEGGDIIYLFSDGMPDQNNLNRQKYGSGRFLKTIKMMTVLSMKDQLEMLKKDLLQYSEGASYRDDITVLGLKI